MKGADTSSEVSFTTKPENIGSLNFKDRPAPLPTERTGWRRLIGSPKLQIIFHNRATKYRSLLQKMTYKDKGSYGSSQPCRCEYDESNYRVASWKECYDCGVHFHLNCNKLRSLLYLCMDVYL